ncbi:MAG: GvpL/GvpF family gas vesicle protein [Actinocatenispora sp.]
MTAEYGDLTEDAADLIVAARRMARERVLAELADEFADRYRSAVARQLARSADDTGTGDTPEEITGTPEAPGTTPVDTDPADGHPTRDAVRTADDRGVPAEETDERAWYVYAILRSRDAELVPTGHGIDGVPNQTVRAGDVAAVTGHVELAGFRTVRANSPDVSEDSWLATAVRAHDRTVSETFTHAPVLPLRFGCLYPSRAALVAALEGAHAELLAELSRLDGAAEWTVQTQLAEPEPASVEEAPRATEEATDGTSWLEARRDAARTRNDRLHRGSRWAKEVVDEVSAHARETVLTAGDKAGRASSATCLVDRSAERAFQAAVDTAQGRHAPTVRIILRGPHPPYHFVRLPEVASGHV